MAQTRVSASSHLQCRPGFVFSPRLGRCVRKSKKTKALRAAPAAGIILEQSSVTEIFKNPKGSIIRWSSRVAGDPIRKELSGKPFYLIARAPNGTLGTSAIIRAVRITDRQTRITVLRRYQSPLALKIKNGRGSGPIVRREDLIFGTAAAPAGPQKEAPKESESGFRKIMASNVGDPTANSGAHWHPVLVRTESRVWSSGGHFHKVVVEHKGEIFVMVTDIDGEHPHALEGELATEEGSEHEHTLGLPPELGGGFVKMSAGAHSHPALVRDTGRGGVHTHEGEILFDGVSIPFTTLTSEEEAMDEEPGFLDGPDGPETTGEDVILIARQLGIDTDDPEKAMEEIIKQTSVQSVLLSKRTFPTLESAQKWIRENGFSDKKVDEKPNTWRFRQFPPGRCKGGTVRTIRARGTRGVQFVICVPKGSVTPPGLAREETKSEAEKRVIAQSKMRVHRLQMGFPSFIRRENLLFAMDKKATGKNGKIVVLMERHRVDGEVMAKGPDGAKDAILIEDPPKGTGKSEAKKLALENIGRRIFVMKNVGDSLVEVDCLLAVIDPTKGEKAQKGDCGCGASN